MEQIQKSKWMLLTVLLILSIMVLASCGNSTEQETTPVATESTAVTSETTAVTSAKPAETTTAAVTPPANETATAVHVNQLGYYPDSTKRAIVATGGREFWVVKADTGDVVYQGKVARGNDKLDPISGEIVCYADFSAVTEPGTYYLMVDGTLPSYAFEIRDGVYHSLLSGILRSWYYLRCGEEETVEYAGEFAHAACHKAPCQVWNGWDRDGDPAYIDLSGGWHDAGDYSKSVNTGLIGVLHMFAAYTMCPDVFDDANNIPESGNGVPDILDEARVELEWCFLMQDADGGVHNNIFPEFHPDFGVMPQEDTSVYYQYPVGREATGCFAQGMACASRLYRPYDAEFADRCLAAAKLAQAYLEAHPDMPAYSAFGYTNGYGSVMTASNTTDASLRCGAALELYLATGDTHYQDIALQYVVEALEEGGQALLQNNVASLACISATFGDSEYEVDGKILRALENRVTWLAKSYKANYYKSAYGLSIDLFWRSTNTLICRATGILLLAERLGVAGDYEKPIQYSVDYLLGSNPLQLCWFTGYGQNPVWNLHYRMGPLSGRFVLPPDGFMPFGAAGYQYALEYSQKIKDYFPEEVPGMQCYTLSDCVFHSMTEFTEGSQGLPLLLFAMMEQSNLAQAGK